MMCFFSVASWQSAHSSKQQGTSRSVCLISLFIISLLCGCGRSSSARLKSYDPPTAAAKAIEIYDRNGDGRLTHDELEKSPALAASLRRLDSNRDGALAAEEIQARFEELDRWARYIGLDAVIAVRGRPLVGAQVTLTPEPFMGEDYPIFSGTTEAGGSLPLTISEGPDVPGVPVGFYTVRIVHPGQNIDAVRGVEIAEDTTGSRLQISL